MQALLLGLGTLLLAVAGVVFTAVNWSQMGASAQGAVLVALTASVVAATVAASRRGLPATAEALGLVAVVLALVDAHAARITFLPQASLAAYWSGGLLVVALVTWALSRVAYVRSCGVVAVAMGQLPLVLLLVATDVASAMVGRDLAAWLAGTLLLVQAAVVLSAVSPRSAARSSFLPLVRVAAAVPAALTWILVTATTAVRLSIEGARAEPALVAVIGASALVAVLVAVTWEAVDEVRETALLGATAIGLASWGWAATLWFDVSIAWASMGLPAAAVAGLGVRSDARWGRSPAVGAGLVAGAVALGVVSAVEVLIDRLAVVVAGPWTMEASERAISASSTGVVGTSVSSLEPVALAVQLGGLALLVWAVAPLTSRRNVVVGGVVLFAVAVALAPLVLPLSVGGAGAVAWLAAGSVLLAAEASLRGAPKVGPPQLGLRGAAAAVGLLLGIAWCWAVAAPSLSVVAGGAVAVAATWILLRALLLGDELVAKAAAGVAVAAVAAEAGIVAAAAGRSGAMAVAIAGAVGLAAATLALLLLPTRLVPMAEAAAWYVHALAVLAVIAGRLGPEAPGLTGAWRATLLAGAAAAVARAARRDLPGAVSAAAAVVAGAEVFVLWSTELAGAGVRAPEPYTLPLAGLFAVAGWWAGWGETWPTGRGGGLAGRTSPDPRGGRLGSWESLGPALLVAAVPTVWLALVEPAGVRPLVALVVGVVVLALGAFHGMRAPVDVGATTVVVLGLARLLPVLAEAPNWLTIGLTGAVLVGVGATFEQRRRDARGVKDRYSALR